MADHKAAKELAERWVREYSEPNMVKLAAAYLDLNTQLEAERKAREHWQKLCKEICEEWNEECDPACDSFAHTDTCKAVFIAQAKRALRERAVAAEAKLAAVERELTNLQPHIAQLPENFQPFIDSHVNAALRALKTAATQVQDQMPMGINPEPAPAAATDKLLKCIAEELQAEWKMSGLADGLYFDFAAEVATRFHATISK